MNHQKTTEKLNKLVAEAWQTKNLKKLEKFCLTPEYQALPYSVKNYPFITASKLKKFSQCELGYKYEYVDLIPYPEEWETPDYFVIGTALDDLLTHGGEYFSERYVTMERRVSNVEDAIDQENAKITEAQNKLNKDGSRSKTGINQEEKSLQKLSLLKKLKDKIQLTQDWEKKIWQMEKEFREQDLFNQEPEKRVVLTFFGNFILKAELDDFEPGIRINDIKTSKNILTFDPEMYEFSMSFYSWLVEEVDGDRLPARLEIVDKNAFISRSRCVEYVVSTLFSNRPKIIEALSKLQDCIDTGIWSETNDRKISANSPYYGYNGYGRQTEVEYY